MFELLKNERYIISPLCEARKDDVVLWSCIEGNIGRVWVSSKESLSCAVVVAADFCFLLGRFEKVYEPLAKVLSEFYRDKVIISEDKSVMMIKDLLDNRCSVRSFLNRDISKDIIDSIIEAGRLSPSGGNEQPWKFGIVTDKVLICSISEIAYNQSWMEQGF